MNLFEKDIESYYRISVPQTKRPDFDSFWEEQLAKVKAHPLVVTGGQVDHPFPHVEVHDLTINGIDDTPIQSWYLLPGRKKEEKLPLIIEFHGYTGNRGYPHNFAHWLSLGCAVLSFDYRMQGGLTGSNTGFTGSPSGHHYTMGIYDKETYYHKYTVTDSLRMIEYALSREEIDSDRIIIEGGSQGGGIAWTVAGLSPSVALCLADVPSHTWFERRIQKRAGSLASVSNLIRRHPDKLDTILNTLSYFDNINFTDRISCPVLVSTGYYDTTCPCENVFAGYNKINSKKEIHVYPGGEHDGGGEFHVQKKIQFVRDYLY
jgi:cephalosporin-C deacetylase